MRSSQQSNSTVKQPKRTRTRRPRRTSSRRYHILPLYFLLSAIAGAHDKDTDGLYRQAIQQGHNDIAKIYAQNAIRKQNERLNLLRLGSRIDAVASRVQTAVTMRQVTGSMTNVVKGMDQAMKAMDLEKVRFPFHACSYPMLHVPTCHEERPSKCPLRTNVCSPTDLSGDGPLRDAIRGSGCRDWVL